MPRIATAALAALIAAASLTPAPALAQFEEESIVAFRAADANGDELLTLDEFRVFIRAMADYGAPMSIRIRNLAVYRIAFARVDTDNDGFATPDELRAAEARGE